MEPRFGYDFGAVRIHADSRANSAARAVQARAFTLGRDVVFAGGHFAPHSPIGRQLLAHELAHVVQQDSGGRRNGHISVPALEVEAERTAVRVATGSPAFVTPGSSPIRLAKSPDTTLPPELGFLTPADVNKLQGFGSSDFQQSIATLREHLGKTGGFTAKGDPHQYIDLRQAAGEIRTFLDYIRNPKVTAAKVVPSSMGGRSPDFYVRFDTGAESRVEVSNVTLASKDVRPDVRANEKGGLSRRIPRNDLADAPGKSVIERPTKEFDHGMIRDAIRSKIKASSKGPSQLDAQNPNTQVGGRPMTPGGDVVIQVTHGEVHKTTLDNLVHELQPELVASSAQKIMVSATDAAEPRAGRKLFEYTRRGNSFEPSVRRPHYVTGASGGESATAPAADSPPQAAEAPKVSGGTETTPRPNVEVPGPKSVPASPGRAGVTRFTPRVGRAAAGVVRGAGGFVKGMFHPSNLAVMIVDMAVSYYIAKAEAELAEKAIQQKLESTDIQKRIEDMTAARRLDLARKQHRGEITYGSVSLHLNFINDMLRSLSTRSIDLTDDDRSSFTSTTMGHGMPFFGSASEDKVWYVTVSVPVPPVETSRSEDLQFQIDDLEEKGRATSDERALGQISAQRNQLLHELGTAKKEEEDARKAELTQPGIIEDSKRRQAQQEGITDELRRLRAEKKPAATKPEPSPAATPGSTSLVPQAPPPPPALLPGAPTEGPIEKAARWVKSAEEVGNRLVDFGNKIGGRESSKEQRDDFLRQEKEWRLRVNYQKNWFHEQSRPEAVQALKQLLEDPAKPGPKLDQLRQRL